MAMSRASAVSAFSPPDSSRTFCRRFPGGWATMSIPASPEVSGSERRIWPVPPPNRVWKAVAKWELTTAKASSNFWRETWSSSAMACCVSVMDWSRSWRSRPRNTNRWSHSLYSSSAIMFTGPMDSMRVFISRYCEMKTRIESMGPVNMMALEEYNECDQRFVFLGRERQDLLQSITDTQQAIAELDQVSRQKFEEAFAVVNSHFAAAFQTLFGGGTGQMRLSEPDSAGDAGIDIVAQPPGKRLQNVLLLSGGEKALTALALLIAIFRYQ